MRAYLGVGELRVFLDECVLLVDERRNQRLGSAHVDRLNEVAHCGGNGLGELRQQQVEGKHVRSANIAWRKRSVLHALPNGQKGGLQALQTRGGRLVVAAEAERVVADADERRTADGQLELQSGRVGAPICRRAIRRNGQCDLFGEQMRTAGLQDYRLTGTHLAVRAAMQLSK